MFNIGENIDNFYDTCVVGLRFGSQNDNVDEFLCEKNIITLLITNVFNEFCTKFTQIWIILKHIFHVLTKPFFFDFFPHLFLKRQKRGFRKSQKSHEILKIQNKPSSEHRKYVQE